MPPDFAIIYVQFGNDEKKTMIICKKQTTDLQQGIQNLIDTMVEDYARWAKSLDWEDSKSTEFADKITTTEGNKYIKIISNKIVIYRSIFF